MTAFPRSIRRTIPQIALSHSAAEPVFVHDDGAVRLPSGLCSRADTLHGLPAELCLSEYPLLSLLLGHRSQPSYENRSLKMIGRCEVRYE
jgi:hypothetical protein